MARTRTKVCASIVEDVHMYITKIVKQTGIGETSVNEILIANTSHPYKLKLRHEILEDDFNCRLEFKGNDETA